MLTDHTKKGISGGWKSQRRFLHKTHFNVTQYFRKDFSGSLPSHQAHNKHHFQSKDYVILIFSFQEWLWCPGRVEVTYDHISEYIVQVGF